MSDGGGSEDLKGKEGIYEELKEIYQSFCTKQKNAKAKSKKFKMSSWFLKNLLRHEKLNYVSVCHFMKDSLMDNKCYFSFNISCNGEITHFVYEKEQEFLNRQSHIELFKMCEYVKTLCPKEDMFYVLDSKTKQSWMILCEIKYFKITHVVKKFYFISYDNKQNFKLLDLKDEDTTNAQNKEIEENTSGTENTEEKSYLDEYITESGEEKINEEKKVEIEIFEEKDESWRFEMLSIGKELLSVESYLEKERSEINNSFQRNSYSTKEGSTVNIHDDISSSFDSVISLKDAEEMVDHTQDNVSSEVFETQQIFLDKDHAKEKLEENDTQDSLTTDPSEVVETEPMLVEHVKKKLGEDDTLENLPDLSEVVQTEPMFVSHAKKKLGEDDTLENLPHSSEVVQSEPMLVDHAKKLEEDNTLENLPDSSEVVQTEPMLVDHAEEKLEDDVSETQNTLPLNIENLNAESSIDHEISDILTSFEEMAESKGTTETMNNTSLVKEKAKRKRAEKLAKAKLEKENALAKFREFLADWDENLKREERERIERKRRNEYYRTMWDAKLAEETRELYKRVRFK